MIELFRWIISASKLLLNELFHNLLSLFDFGLSQRKFLLA